MKHVIVSKNDFCGCRVTQVMCDYLYEIQITVSGGRFDGQTIEAERFQLSKFVPLYSHVKVISDAYLGLTGSIQTMHQI